MCAVFLQNRGSLIAGDGPWFIDTCRASLFTVSRRVQYTTLQIVLQRRPQFYIGFEPAANLEPLTFGYTELNFFQSWFCCLSTAKFIFS